MLGARAWWLVVATSLSAGLAWADDGPQEKLRDVLETSSSFKVRATAAVALGRLGDPAAVDPLGRALRRDAHFAVRAAAASALSRIDDDAAARTLLDGLGDDDEFVLREVEKALRSFHRAPRQGVFIAELTAGKDETRRRAAALALAAIAQAGDDDVARLLVDGLADDARAVRTICRQALDTLERRRAVPLLVLALTHEEADVRRQVARLLAARPDASAKDKLTVALMRLGEEASVRRAVVDAVAAHRAFFDEDALAKTASAGEDEDARLAAIAVLGALAGREHITRLSALLQDPSPRVRSQAATALIDADRAAAKVAIAAQVAREADDRTKRRLEALLRALR